MESATTLIGNLVRDPELRFTQSGRAVANLSMAVSRRWKNQSDEWTEETSYFDVTVWASLAENVAASLAKGDRVVCAGRLEQQTWETNEGDKRSKVILVADAVGADLRFATVEIQRTERSTPTSGPSGYGNDPFA